MSVIVEILDIANVLKLSWSHVYVQSLRPALS